MKLSRWLASLGQLPSLEKQPKRLWWRWKPVIKVPSLAATVVVSMHELGFDP